MTEETKEKENNKITYMCCFVFFLGGVFIGYWESAITAFIISIILFMDNIR